MDKAKALLVLPVLRGHLDRPGHRVSLARLVLLDRVLVPLALLDRLAPLEPRARQALLVLRARLDPRGRKVLPGHLVRLRRALRRLPFLRRRRLHRPRRRLRHPRLLLVVRTVLTTAICARVVVAGMARVGARHGISGVRSAVYRRE